jgi:hypothetical protein
MNFFEQFRGTAVAIELAMQHRNAECLVLVYSQNKNKWYDPVPGLQD